MVDNISQNTTLRAKTKEAPTSPSYLMSIPTYVLLRYKFKDFAMVLEGPERASTLASRRRCDNVH